jgi:hypothetical protein
VLLADLRAAGYLVDHELGVKEHPDALDSVTAGELESFDESPILRNGVDGGSDPFGDLRNWVTFGVAENDSDRTFGWIVDGPAAGTVCMQYVVALRRLQLVVFVLVGHWHEVKLSRRRALKMPMLSVTSAMGSSHEDPAGRERTVRAERAANASISTE